MLLVAILIIITLSNSQFDIAFQFQKATSKTSMIGKNNRVYLSAPFNLREELKADIVPALQESGFRVTSNWLFQAINVLDLHNKMTDNERLEACSLEAWRDYAEVRQSDIYMRFANTSDHKSLGGKYVEMGIALASHLHIILVGPKECIFDWMRSVRMHRFDSFAEALREMKRGL